MFGQPQLYSEFAGRSEICAPMCHSNIGAWLQNCMITTAEMCIICYICLKNCRIYKMNLFLHAIISFAGQIKPKYCLSPNFTVSCIALAGVVPASKTL
jgi:hypothetical protein